MIDIDEQLVVAELVAIQRDFDDVAGQLSGLRQDLSGLVADIRSAVDGTVTGIDRTSVSVLSGSARIMKTTGDETAEIARLAGELATMLAEK